jgi:hypothetical protein
MTAYQAAEIAVDKMFAHKRVVVPGAKNKFAIFMNRFVPRRLATRAVKKIQEARLNRSEDGGLRSENGKPRNDGLIAKVKGLGSKAKARRSNT